ncbi:asparagine synthase (glutamine-hydrolyzing) [Bacteroidota bacterium]
MCGFAGYQSKQGTGFPGFLQRMCHSIAHRGPDAEGFWEQEGTGLGHRRLSIIDLSTGGQPMLDSGQGNVLVFNGEIYNFLKLRQELIQLGIELSTHSDTEVILKGFTQWGMDTLLQKLEGMFAFALYEAQGSRLWIARDKFGEKPLYYSTTDKGLFFGSELKALKAVLPLQDLDSDALRLYFQFSYIPAPYTIYKEVKKLEAGNYLLVESGRIIQQQVYYDLASRITCNSKTQMPSYEEACKQVYEQLNESVEERMIADVPLGSFLSGGVDSSIITALMARHSRQPVKTFSIGFEEKEYDESERARLVANFLGTEHHVRIVKARDLLDRVDRVLATYDEPFGDSSAIPSSMVAELAAEEVKVVLTGDCADELFGGYEKYLGPYYSEKWNNLPGMVRKPIAGIVNHLPHTNLTNHTLRKLKKVIRNASFGQKERYLRLSAMGFQPEELQELLVQNDQKSKFFFPYSFWEDLELGELERSFYSDVKLVLEGDMLVKVDRASMLHSLETRSPFLHSGLVELALKLPAAFKIRGKEKKVLLKDAFRSLLPQETLQFSKKGFGLPIRIWFRNELKAELLDKLSDKKLSLQGLFSIPYIHRLLEEHFSGKENHSVKLWQLFVFQKWYENNVH